MLYAKVVLGLPVEGPFDYKVPPKFYQKIAIGSRVWVNFGPKKLPGYVVKLTRKTEIKKLKEVLEVIDHTPILDKNMLLLSRDISRYYCCCWGEAIESALPEPLRKGKRVPLPENYKAAEAQGKAQTTLIHDLDGKARWGVYLEEIKESLARKKSAIILLPDKTSILPAKKMIKAKLGVSPVILYRKAPQEAEEWLKVKRQEADIIIGTRSAIFAPLSNLGLVIIEQEEDSVYKQDQVPHYQARQVAAMRVNRERAKLVLGTISPSLESFYLSQVNKSRYLVIPRARKIPEIKIIDTKQERRYPKQKNIILSRYLADAITINLNSKGKTLLFLNRKGFATSASCHNCGAALRCPRCNINLVYHFKYDILECRYCNFKMSPPKICPACNAGYIKYSGTGTEKVESELARIFPQARLKSIDETGGLNLEDIDICVATSRILKQADCAFSLVGVLSIDNSLNRPDLAASEKTFALLAGLLNLAEGKLVIQTGFPQHHCFRALLKNDPQIFYKEELKQRKQLNFPPYRHLGLVKLRGAKDDKVKVAAHSLFKKLSESNQDKGIQVISVNPGEPPKLRGKFYWQVLLSSGSAGKLSAFLKINLKSFLHSGIIVTVDIDPL